MSRKSDWNLQREQGSLKFLHCTGVAFLVLKYFSPQSETLVQVGELPLILYSIGFGLAFLVFGEMLGLSERRIIRFSVRRLILYFLAAFLASLALLLGVWIIEFSFVGRFAILKIALSTGLASFFCFGCSILLPCRAGLVFFFWLPPRARNRFGLRLANRRVLSSGLIQRELEPGASWLNFAKMKKWT